MPLTQTPFETIGFDADDTLWQNECFFHEAQRHFEAMMRDHATPEGTPEDGAPKSGLAERLLAAEARNIRHYGFGVKSFTLSMIETAIEVSDGAVPAPVIGAILEIGREMLSHPVELLPGVGETLETLAGRYRLVLVTKGDLMDQERKLRASGLADLFDGVEIVSDKQPDTYRRVFARHGTGPEQAMMVGNSLKSDVLPMLEAGGWAVHVPHELTWALEHAVAPENHPRFGTVPSLRDLDAFIDTLTASAPRTSLP